MREVNVAIADDNERILDMLGEIIEQDQDLNLIGKADNGEDIYHLIKEKKPDVVLLDLIMPKMDGLSVMEKVNMDEQITKRPEFIIVADKEYFYHCCITSHFLVFLGFSGFVSLCKFLLSGITWFIFA